MEMRAISSEDPARLVRSLTGAIRGCGGRVIGRGANLAGTVKVTFEFERLACLEIYGVLVATGVEFGQTGHNRLTELCQCTVFHPEDCGTEIASIELEILTSPSELIRGASARLAA